MRGAGPGHIPGRGGEVLPPLQPLPTRCPPARPPVPLPSSPPSTPERSAPRHTPGLRTTSGDSRHADASHADATHATQLTKRKSRRRKSCNVSHADTKRGKAGFPLPTNLSPEGCWPGPPPESHELGRHPWGGCRLRPQAAWAPPEDGCPSPPPWHAWWGPAPWLVGGGGRWLFPRPWPHQGPPKEVALVWQVAVPRVLKGFCLQSLQPGFSGPGATRTL